MAIAYKPLDTSNINSVSNIIEQKVQDIPNYEDRGISFQGKYKIQISEKKYELRAQSENSIVVTLNDNLVGLPAGTYYLALDHPLQNFVFQFFTINWKLTAIKTEVRFIDDKGSNGLTMVLPSDASGNYSAQIIPKTYYGDRIKVEIDTNIPANEFVNISLWGWYEDQ